MVHVVTDDGARVLTRLDRIVLLVTLVLTILRALSLMAASFAALLTTSFWAAGDDQVAQTAGVVTLWLLGGYVLASVLFFAIARLHNPHRTARPARTTRA